MVAVVSLCLLLSGGAHAANNGRALTPPLGWRSWNCFYADIDQEKITAQIDAIVAERVLPGSGQKTTLQALGFNSVGIDEGYEGCGLGVNGTVHTADGTPTIDPKRFPNMSALVEHAHGLGVEIGWYLNGCGCNERRELRINYEGDVRATVGLGFDSVKIDSCGAQKNMTLYGELFNQSGVAIQVEECHQGQNFTDGGNPGQMGPGWCPFNTFRTSGDIVNLWDRVMSNLLTVAPFLAASQPLSRPGCWAYPDMLEIGRMPEHNVAESRSHFSAWAMVSAPLVLGFDLTDEAQMAAAWPVLSNTKVIDISQAHEAGRAWPSGRLAKSWRAAQPPTIAVRGGCGPAACRDGNPKCAQWAADNQCVVNPGYMQSNCARSCGACPGGSYSGWSFDAGAGALREAGSGLCLDAAGQLASGSAPFNVLHMQPCAAGGADNGTQRFTFANASAGGQLRSVATGECLRVDRHWLWNYEPVVHLGGCDSSGGATWTLLANGTLANAAAGCVAVSTRFGPPSTVWTKPLPGRRTALLAINGADRSHAVTLDFASLLAGAAPAGAGPAYTVEDVWDPSSSSGPASAQAGGPRARTNWTATLAAHDCVLLVLSPA
eukprot:g6070.t1